MHGAAVCGVVHAAAERVGRGGNRVAVLSREAQRQYEKNNPAVSVKAMPLANAQGFSVQRQHLVEWKAQPHERGNADYPLLVLEQPDTERMAIFS